MNPVVSYYRRNEPKNSLHPDNRNGLSMCPRRGLHREVCRPLPPGKGFFARRGLLSRQIHFPVARWTTLQAGHCANERGRTGQPTRLNAAEFRDTLRASVSLGEETRLGKATAGRGRIQCETMGGSVACAVTKRCRPSKFNWGAVSLTQGPTITCDDTR